ncbi:MAG: hypothetical protein R3A47_10245 [Polyangiales bacterium]
MTAGRIMAIDPGTKRIGVAISDDTGVLAFPTVSSSRLEAMSDDRRASSDCRRKTG